MELLDIYDASGAHLGVKPRDEVHRDGDWHRCFHLWVVDARGVVFQRRADDGRIFAGMLDATAAGHLVAGESVADGLREVEEELGATWPLTALTDLGVHRVDDRPAPGVVNREFQHVHAIRDDRPLEAWTALHPVEVAGLVHVTFDGFDALLDGRPAHGRAWDLERVRDVEVGAGEVVPAVYLATISARLRVLGVM